MHWLLLTRPEGQEGKRFVAISARRHRCNPVGRKRQPPGQRPAFMRCRNAPLRRDRVADRASFQKGAARQFPNEQPPAEQAAFKRSAWRGTLCLWGVDTPLRRNRATDHVS
ncbi:hypothetical protein SKAU_G00072030 [Synaphobranchus kaupii]|uniref:Uncharacterized protein n=1 Tax=Synaphobranchus kaupii TaxID=118154 RepID=A0A9Q1JBE1_SYNKA|nr:hypothetical protein SKAU_G00072030 [Synaphobranchus kaupii]